MDDKLGKTFPEDQARGYFIQLMLGLEYRKKGVDLNPDHLDHMIPQYTTKRSFTETSSRPIYW